MSKTCKTCKHWDIEYARRGTKRISPYGLAQCNYPMQQTILPASHPLFLDSLRKKELNMMAACYGEHCPVWEKRAITKTKETA